MSFQHTFDDLRMKVMSNSHRTLWKLSGGRIGSTIANMPVVELHTIGRTSGRRRSTMLTSPIRVGDAWVIVASKGGDDRDPDWYRNLVAQPEVELTVDGTDVPCLARTATDDEKAELWPQITDAYGGYAGYARRTDRDIPVVLCTPRAD